MFLEEPCRNMKHFLCSRNLSVKSCGFRDNWLRMIRHDVHMFYIEPSPASFRTLTKMTETFVPDNN